jgi:hypothetical protein
MVGIGAHSLVLLHGRMSVGNFMRWGQGMLERGNNSLHEKIGAM